MSRLNVTKISSLLGSIMTLHRPIPIKLHSDQQFFSFSADRQTDTTTDRTENNTLIVRFASVQGNNMERCAVSW